MTENARYSRRHIVASGAATVVGLAGCLSDGESTPEPVDVTLTNATDERYEVDVRIELREEALLDRTFTLYASGEVETAFENPDEPGDGTLSVAVDGGESTESELRIGPSTGLSSVTITIEEGGSVATMIGVE